MWGGLGWCRQVLASVVWIGRLKRARGLVVLSGVMKCGLAGALVSERLVLGGDLINNNFAVSGRGWAVQCVVVETDRIGGCNIG